MRSTWAMRTQDVFLLNGGSVDGSVRWRVQVNISQQNGNVAHLEELSWTRLCHAVVSANAVILHIRQLLIRYDGHLDGGTVILLLKAVVMHGVTYIACVWRQSMMGDRADRVPYAHMYSVSTSNICFREDLVPSSASYRACVVLLLSS